MRFDVFDASSFNNTNGTPFLDEEETWFNGDEVVTGAPSTSPSLSPSSITITQAPSITPSSSPSLPLITNQAESIAEHILPRITAFISLLGVICVAMEAFGDLTRRKPSNTHRYTPTQSQRQANQQRIAQIQLSYQIALFCYSLAFALGSFTAPSDQQIWGAYGNQATCSTQAFFFQFGMYGSLLWDASLSTTYYRMVNNKTPTSTHNNKSRVILWVHHLIIWPIALAVSIYPLTTDYYNFNYTTCWINEYPYHCQESGECLRGDGSTLWINMASLAAILHLIYSIAVMIGLYWSIRTLERKRANSRSATNSGDGMTVATGATTATTRTTYSRKIAIQGLLYASGMILTMLPTAIMVLLANMIGYWSNGLSTFAITMTPLVGYLNFVIYMRNRREDQCHTRYAKLLRKLHSCILDRDWSCGCCRGCSAASLSDETYRHPPPQEVQKTPGKPRDVSKLTCSGLQSRDLDPFDSDESDSIQDIDMPPLSDVDLEADTTDDHSSCDKLQQNNQSSQQFNFKTWKSSEVSDFETWRSEADSEVLVTTATASSSPKMSTKKAATTTDFKTWKSSCVSDFETWESEMIVEEDEDIQPQKQQLRPATTTTNNFRTWKDSKEVSGFETWQSEMITEEDEEEVEEDFISTPDTEEEEEDGGNSTDGAGSTDGVVHNYQTSSDEEDVVSSIRIDPAHRVNRWGEKIRVVVPEKGLKDSDHSNTSTDATHKTKKRRTKKRRERRAGRRPNKNTTTTNETTTYLPSSYKAPAAKATDHHDDFKTWKSQLLSETWESEVLEEEQQQPPPPEEAPAPIKKKPASAASSLSVDFKTWKTSCVSDFETWESEVVED